MSLITIIVPVSFVAPLTQKTDQVRRRMREGSWSSKGVFRGMLGRDIGSTMKGVVREKLIIGKRK